MSWYQVYRSLYCSSRAVRSNINVAPASSMLAVRGLRLSRAMLMSDGEKKISDILTKALQPTYLKVEDISGGCGSMYEIVINSEMLDGKRLVQQHKMVNEALGDEVKKLHGLTIRIGDPNAQK